MGILTVILTPTSNDSTNNLSPSQRSQRPPASLTMPSSTSSQSRPIVVLGAGIIGLSTAVRLLESLPIRRQGQAVHVVADHLPADPLDPMYASTIAGAHHLSFADDGDARQRRWDSKSESQLRWLPLMSSFAHHDGGMAAGG